MNSLFVLLLLIAVIVIFVSYLLRNKEEKDQDSDLELKPDECFTVKPDYSLTNEDYVEKLESEGFCIKNLDPDVLKNAPRKDTNQMISIGTKKFEVYKPDGTIKEGLERVKLSEIDFPTFCEFLIKYQEYSKVNHLAIEWLDGDKKVYYAYCIKDEISIASSSHGCGWHNIWLFVGAKKK